MRQNVASQRYIEPTMFDLDAANVSSASQLRQLQAARNPRSCYCQTGVPPNALLECRERHLKFDGFEQLIDIIQINFHNALVVAKANQRIKAGEFGLLLCKRILR